MIKTINNKKTIVKLVIILVLIALILVFYIYWKGEKNKEIDNIEYQTVLEEQEDNSITNEQEFIEEKEPEINAIEEGENGDIGDINFFNEMARNEIAFSEAIMKFDEAYPWYRKFPIDNNKYVIVYDLSVEKFRIRLKITKESPQELVDSLKREAVNDIETIMKRTVKENEYYLLFVD